MNKRIRTKIVKNHVKGLYGENTEHIHDSTYIYALSAKKNIEWLRFVKHIQYTGKEKK